MLILIRDFWGHRERKLWLLRNSVVELLVLVRLKLLLRKVKLEMIRTRSLLILKAIFLYVLTYL